MIVGVDEVGRGAIAGDLVVCAAAFRDEEVLVRLREAGCELLDSKAFSSRKRRERAFEILMAEEGVLWSIARCSPEEIEAQGIHLAVLNCMEAAALCVSDGTEVRTECIFDGRFVPAGMLAHGGKALVKGDSKVSEISAASIIAKVIRDREMVDLGGRYPEYGFDQHAGYGTARHIEAIREHGLIADHRSWARKFLQDVVE